MTRIEIFFYSHSCIWNFYDKTTKLKILLNAAILWSFSSFKQNSIFSNEIKNNLIRVNYILKT